MMTDVHILRRPDNLRLLTETGALQAETAAGLGPNGLRAGDIEIDFAEKDGGLAVSMTSGGTPVRFLELRWQGGFAPGVRFLGDAFERNYGNLEWRGFVPDRLMPWYFLASGGGRTAGMGVKVRPNCFAFWMADPEGVTLWLDVRCGGKGVILDGHTLSLATLVQAESEGEDAFDFMKSFCRRMCDDPLAPPAPVYGSNNWYYAYGNSSHEEILRDTALLAELTKGIENRPYMVIDDCWQPLALSQGAAGRPYENGNVRFPDMPGLAREMRELGVKPGIWIRPEETNEMFLDGKLRCDRDRRYLDLTEPEALRLIGEDVTRVTGWGFEFVKFDFATIDAIGTFAFQPLDVIRIKENWAWHDRSQTNAQAIMNVYKTILAHANGAVILGCNVVGHLGAGLMHMHRSGDDTSGCNWDRTMIMGVNTLAFRLAQHKAFFHIDADCVGVTSQIDWEMNRQFLELLALSGTPLFCSMKPSDLTEEMKTDLKAAFRLAAEQNTEMKPLDWMDNSIPARYAVDGKTYTYHWMQKHGMNGFSA